MAMQASEVCPRPASTRDRTADQLKQEIQAIEKALRDRERQHGATIEQIFAELDVRKQTYREAKRSIKDWEMYIKVSLFFQ